MFVSHLEKPASYYELLEITPGASDEEVKRAYRQQALKFHPDRPGLQDRRAAELRFRQVNEAYAQLKTHERRTAYNTVLAANTNTGRSPSFWAQVANIFVNQKSVKSRS